jgi:16S rRNA (adenine1518-N6/adenine1519-N6)-dimethyltransferase
VSSIRLLRERGLRPKKSFGQNFLQDPNTCARIAELCTTPEGGVVLEIGAGLGALTKPLLERAARVIAIERDRDLVPILRELFEDTPHLEIVEADAVKVDWRAHLQGGPSPRVIAGNLPYQITGRLIQRSVALADIVDCVVFMVQREVADRLAAKPGGRDYGALSVFTQAAFDVARALKVPAGAFVPAPKVDSAVIVLTPLRPPRAIEDDTFRNVVKRAFNQRRKTLRNAWKALLSKDELEAAAATAGIDLGARAETLDVEAFARMASAVRG